MTYVKTIPISLHEKTDGYSVFINNVEVSFEKNRFDSISNEYVQKAIKSFYNVPNDITGILFPYKDLDYLISSDGFMYSLKTKRKLKGVYKDGCPVIIVSLNGYQMSLWLAKNVMETFLGPSDHNAKVEFKDGNKQNCQLNNLYWSTDSKSKYR